MDPTGRFQGHEGLLGEWLSKPKWLAKELKFVPPPHRALSSFIWTALYQVEGWSYNQIAKYNPAGPPVTTPTVREAVPGILELLGLAPRPD